MIIKKIFLILILILVCGCSNNPIKESVEKEIKEPTEQAVDTINSARDAAFDRNAELYISTVNKEIARYQVNNSYAEFSNIESCDITTNEIICGEYHISVEIDGHMPIRGIIILKNGQVAPGTEVEFETGKYKVN